MSSIIITYQFPDKQFVSSNTHWENQHFKDLDLVLTLVWFKQNFVPCPCERLLFIIGTGESRSGYVRIRLCCVVLLKPLVHWTPQFLHDWGTSLGNLFQWPIWPPSWEKKKNENPNTLFQFLVFQTVSVESDRFIAGARRYWSPSAGLCISHCWERWQVLCCWLTMWIIAVFLKAFSLGR